MSSNNHGVPRLPMSIQPNLQPKPVAISPIRQPMQTVIGQPMIPRIQAHPSILQRGEAGQASLVPRIHGPKFGQNPTQFMLSSMGQAVPVNMAAGPRMTAQVIGAQNQRISAQMISAQQPRMSQIVSAQQPRMSQMVSAQQPRMSAQVIGAQQPRMAMYVQQTGNIRQMTSASIPKLVTGVPVYQNNPQFQQGQIRIQQGPVATPVQLKPAVTGMTTASAQSSNRQQPTMTFTAQGSSHGQLQGQFQRVATNQMGQQFIRAGQAIPANIQAFRHAGQLQQTTNYGFAGYQVRNIQPSSTIQGGQSSQNQSIQPKPTPVQVLSSISQIPTPQFFTSIGSSVVTPISSQFPSSPLVPLSPSMFQVARPIGASLGLTSGDKTPSSTVLRFANTCTSSPSSIHSLQVTKPTHTTEIQSVAITTSVISSAHVTIATSSVANSNEVTVANNTPKQSNIYHLSTTAGIIQLDSGASNISIPSDLLAAGTSSPSPDLTTTSPSTDVFNDKENDSNQTGNENKTLNDIHNQNEHTESFKESVLNLRQNKDPVRPKTDSEVLSDKDMVEKCGDLTESSPESKSSPQSGEGERMECEEGSTGKGESVESSEVEMVTGDSDEEFVWEEYLQDMGAVAVPPTAFKHVECSLQSGFVKGMKLEVPNKADNGTYWVASVVMTSGPLLRLRFDGYENDSLADFWCDMSTSEVHSIGWCAQNGQNLQPPEEIKNKFTDWREYLMTSLTGARTAPSFLLDKDTGSTPVDQFKPGMRLELQDAVNPLEVWLVQIIENVGGRLYVRLEGTESAAKDFWMFYLNPRLHPIGWGKQEGCTYTAPKEIIAEHDSSKWEEILEAALKQSEQMVMPVDLMKDQVELKPHKFELGMKVEALYPGQNMICPATVVKVISSKYFMVEIDDLRKEEKRESIQVCCHSEYLGIFPVLFSQCKGIRLQIPPGWNEVDFVWGEYLAFCNAKAAPERLFHSGTDDHEFERGMKFEAVNPENTNQICAATITKIVGPLLWIHLDNMRNVPSHIEDIDSQNLFPVGWCESNSYTLKPPRSAGLRKARKRRSSENLYGEAYRSDTYSHFKSGNEGGSWCPTIYFNHRCFSGPFLGKGRISELPKSVGPGPMGLVLKTVIELLVNVAYKSSRVLKELQQEGPPNPNMQPHMLKAKYKGKSYRAVVEVCRMESQLEEFCRNVCIQLECCPYLFSPLYVEESCPENCQQLTKTKYNYNYGKKKKKAVGRPRLNSEETGTGPKLPMKRGRKKKRFHLIQKKKSHPSQSSNYFYNRREPRDEGFIEDDRAIDYDYYEEGMMTPSKKRKYTHHVPAPSDIQTRGAKLPKYSFERKTHKKILLSSGSPPKAKEKMKYKTQLSKQASPVKHIERSMLLHREESLHLESNPLHWTIADVITFIKSTDSAHLARIIKEQEIDGQALLLLNLSTIQEHLDLKLGPAVKLCHQIERLKVAFYETYA